MEFFKRGSMDLHCECCPTGGRGRKKGLTDSWETAGGDVGGEGGEMSKSGSRLANVGK